MGRAVKGPLRNFIDRASHYGSGKNRVVGIYKCKRKLGRHPLDSHPARACFASADQFASGGSPCIPGDQSRCDRPGGYAVPNCIKGALKAAEQLAPTVRGGRRTGQGGNPLSRAPRPIEKERPIRIDARTQLKTPSNRWIILLLNARPCDVGAVATAAAPQRRPRALWICSKAIYRVDAWRMAGVRADTAEIMPWDIPWQRLFGAMRSPSASASVAVV
ncbi:hypothetical protein N7532_005052 [Penicillium argentinense]|uniref:Uncharacterized protein n=1 Tax=Penicillium argentinense TaxID=1131581 RepID=A0A9W9FDB8_9EURO|nr:uncharacterized protein N7532_005052 [Penicillium argentinense]KAJ5098051.1 hypothetical protein N7532_005052 [Penicillium argentinense]